LPLILAAFDPCCSAGGAGCILMAPAPAQEQGFQNFSAPTPAPFDLNFAGSGSDSAPLQLRSKLKFAISH